MNNEDDIDITFDDSEVLNITIEQNKEQFITQYRRDFNPINALIRLGVASSSAAGLAEQYLSDPYVQSRLSELSEVDSPLNNPKRTRSILAEKLYSLSVDSTIEPKVRVNAIGMLLRELPAEQDDTSDKIMLPSDGLSYDEWSMNAEKYTRELNTTLDLELLRIEKEKGADNF